jgi:serine/threonine-protein kinase
MIDAETPVGNPADFVGQAGIVRRVFSRIGAERPQSVAVIGGMKSGKTSLLAYLSDQGVASQHLEAVDKFVFLSLRANREMTDDPDSFLGSLSKRLAPGAAGGSNRYETIRKGIEDLHAGGKRVIVFLDDFHFITSNDRFPLEFFSFLRSMANNYNLAYVTTSLLELQKLCVAKDVQESPFFNIFTNMHLGMLSREDATALFVRVTGTGEAPAGRVAAWCGGSPYLLKKAGARLAQGKSSDRLSDADLEKILLPEVTPYFEEVVSLLPPEAFKPLQAVMRGKAPSQSDEHQLSSLVKQGFLVEGEGGEGISSFSPAFALFLRKSLSQRMLKGSG